MGKYLKDYQIPSYSEKEDRPQFSKKPRKFKEDEPKMVPKKKTKR